MRTEFLWINMNGRDHRGGPGSRYEEAVTYVFKKRSGRAWAGLIWLRKGINYI
jgi:hypothetical protein